MHQQDNSDSNRMSQTAQPDGLFRAPRRLGWVMRLLCFLAGVNPMRLAGCPTDDRQATIRVGVAMLVSFLFVTASLTLALSIAFGLTGSGVLFAVPVAALLAGAYILVDHALVQSDWYQSGLRAARHRGFQPDGPRLPGILHRLLLACFRLLLSGVLAYLAATFVEIAVFSKDIERQRLDNHRAANAAVYAAASAQTAAQIAQRDAELGAIAEARAAALVRQAEASRTLDAIIRSGTASRDARIALLQTEFDRQQADIARRRGDAIAEQFGRREAPHHTGVAGQRAQYQAAIAFAAQAEARAALIQAEIDQLRAAEIPGRRELASTLEQARLDLDQAAQRRQQVVAEQERLITNRPAIVRAAAEADPRFVALQDGIFERLSVLDQLLQDPGAWRAAMGILAFMMVAEMAGLLTKLLLTSPGLYAIRTATEIEVGAAETIAGAEADLTATSEALLAAQEARAAAREARDLRADRRRTANMARGLYAKGMAKAEEE